MALADWTRLLAAVTADVQRMRVYEESLVQLGRRDDLLRAWNQYERTGAFQRAQTAQSRAALRLFLQAEIGRPHPPAGYEGEPDSWAAVKAHLARQLEAVGGPLGHPKK